MLCWGSDPPIRRDEFGMTFFFFASSFSSNYSFFYSSIIFASFLLTKILLSLFSLYSVTAPCILITDRGYHRPLFDPLEGP